MTELTNKEKREQKIFAAFAKRSGLNISETSIKSCKPPMPDICCDLDGSKYFFELAEVVPQVQAQTLSTKGVYISDFPDQEGPRAMTRILKQKQKRYMRPVTLQLTSFCFSIITFLFISQMSIAMEPNQQT